MIEDYSRFEVPDSQKRCMKKMEVRLMYKTFEEITNQYESLAKTWEYFTGMGNEIKNFLANPRHKSIIFLGSGSSYAVCKSAEAFFNTGSRLKAYSFAAGDMMLNFPHYENIVRDSVLIALSRSGSTSEVVEVFKKSKGLASGTVSVCAKEKSPLSGIVDLSLEIPWAFDESVCQTRTVTNLYASGLMMLASYTDDETTRNELKNGIDTGRQLLLRCMPVLEDLVKSSEWDKAVVLADSHLAGIGEEAALAFKEICRVHSNFYHVLDVRHGPMVLIDDRTLVILAVTPFGPDLQKDLVSDLKSRGAKVITVGPTENGFESDLHVRIGSFYNYAVSGIQFILIPQLVSYFKAIRKGVNPDSPEGLDPWIELKR